MRVRANILDILVSQPQICSIHVPIGDMKSYLREIIVGTFLIDNFFGNSLVMINVSRVMAVVTEETNLKQ